ncbi:RNA-binding transcriptional accessory protein [Enterococcus cecorum]|uniref:Tex family protein n=1 Tax=Enterococcus cecorum TaxID=44008 RepID=UPI00148CF3FA|nr:Tex family protein [Enterococcus cecorum]MCJ0570684.1 RNA-binding transcriptional accessory protein [Enterococcus cecorum]MCJ0578209.1 RNA-binding transcriptional accessory protein [Enterococcus cecorum]MCJ0584553.1 RNA-binding transcriptional accessory protein [Enterococcus cecorum]MCJ0588966.1 RNA-binding transcriptional accessory protein [Enterococcus cecorum]MCJ0592570.1 RNA-binding transcriptional accessory protein [Enterococcus cecorum]
MEQFIIQQLVTELAPITKVQIEAVLNLLADGATIPFIARYRKEKTGSLDEVQIKNIQDRYQYLENLQKRKEEIIENISNQGKLTEELRAEILAANVLQKLEDLYRPYKQKKRTKATIAKENGLEPLSEAVFQNQDQAVLEKMAQLSTNEAVPTLDDVWNGVHEILAEKIADEAKYREWIRNFTYKNGQYTCQVKDESLDERKVYEIYYEFTQPIKSMVSHRILATNRGEKEGVLKVNLEVDTNKIHEYLARHIIPKKANEWVVEKLTTAYEDAYKRFIQPAIEREIRNELTEKADEQAIEVFGENLRNLLLQSPLKGKVVMGFDPAYRTGCKLAIMDPTGKVLAIDVIYATMGSEKQLKEAAKKFIQLIEDYQVEMVAIGNGTASRESEQFVAEQLKKINRKVYYIIVNEAGASVYSASEVARAEFPDLQVEQRSAVSIGRRLQDPLAELVKIDPKAVGVGQYQHDVSQKQLAQQLDFVVETVVNQVGVNVNTASSQLLARIAGLNKTTAQNIVNYREENGAFSQRNQLKKVPRLGPKAFEQAIGFLRIPNGKNILDNTPIHPESYQATKDLLATLNIDLDKLDTPEAKSELQKIDIKQLSEKLAVGRETLQDIIDSLLKPGRDLRDDMPAPILRSDVLSIEDLKVGMKLQGTVRNVIDFGAFVDIGVKQDGLVHISKLSDRFVKHPSEVVAVGDIVQVWITSVDTQKGRIGLSMLASDGHE